MRQLVEFAAESQLVVDISQVGWFGCSDRSHLRVVRTTVRTHPPSISQLQRSNLHASTLHPSSFSFHSIEPLLLRPRPRPILAPIVSSLLRAAVAPLSFRALVHGFPASSLDSLFAPQLL